MDRDETPTKPTNMVIGANLDAVSVFELEQYIINLDSEIMRVRNEITKKQASKAAADNFFKL